MNKITRSLLALTCLLTAGLCTQAQELPSSDFYRGIKDVDAGKLWHTPPGRDLSEAAEITVPEPLGFIGDQYQRFYIHYLSVIKSRNNPYQYLVAGKTKVKGNVCNFRGTITILRSGLYKKQFDYRYKQGFVECLIDFKEDSSQRSAGCFLGKLRSNFYLDEKGKLQYDDLLFGADGFFNNQCETSWTAYHTSKSKKVNWGDYRIPASKGLDIGDGEFAVNARYKANGWQNYMMASSGDPEQVSTQQAQQAEAQAWWK